MACLIAFHWLGQDSRDIGIAAERARHHRLLLLCIAYPRLWCYGPRCKGNASYAPLVLGARLPLALMAGGGQAPVQFIGGTNESNMGEGLGKVAQMFAPEAEFFSVQAEMIGVSQRLLEKEAGFVQVTGPRQALYVPERAHRKRAFLPQEPVIECVAGLITIDQRVGNQYLLNSP